MAVLLGLLHAVRTSVEQTSIKENHNIFMARDVTVVVGWNARNNKPFAPSSITYFSSKLLYLFELKVILLGR